MEMLNYGTIKIKVSADELRAIAEKLRGFESLYPMVWREINAGCEKAKAAPLLEPNPIRLRADDPEQFLEWLTAHGFKHIADRAIMPPAQ